MRVQRIAVSLLRGTGLALAVMMGFVIVGILVVTALMVAGNYGFGVGWDVGLVLTIVAISAGLALIAIILLVRQPSGGGPNRSSRPVALRVLGYVLIVSGGLAVIISGLLTFVVAWYILADAQVFSSNPTHTLTFVGATILIGVIPALAGIGLTTLGLRLKGQPSG